SPHATPGKVTSARHPFPGSPAAPQVAPATPFNRFIAGSMKAARRLSNFSFTRAASMLIAATTAQAVRWSAGGTRVSCEAGARLPPDQPAAAATQAPADL